MSDWFWLLAILVTTVNAGILYVRAQPRIRADPSLAPGYRQLILGYLVFLNLPWIVMGIGGAPIDDYVRPTLGDPAIVAFHASIVLVWVVTSVWLFRGGAEILATHPGAMRGIRTPLTVKVGWALALTGGIVAMSVMWLA